MEWILKTFFPVTYYSIWNKGYDDGTKALKLIDKHLKELNFDFSKKNKKTRKRDC